MRNRGHIRLGRDVHIGDFCRVLAGAQAGSIRMGDRIFIHEFCILKTAGDFIHLGRECSLNPFCVVYGDGGVTIGDCVRIAAHTTIVAAEHKFDKLDIPITRQGAVVTRDVEPDTIVAGVPARPLRRRAPAETGRKP